MNIASAKLLGIGHLDPDRSWHMQAHAHPFHELIVVVQGKMRVVLGGRTVATAAGDVLLYPAGTGHEERSDPDEPVESFFASFELSSLPGDLRCPAHDADGRVREMIRWLYADRRSFSPAESQLVFRALLAIFFRERRQDESGIVMLSRQYVREHIGERLTLAILARQAGMSKFHFLRTYRALAGRTPMSDVRAIRAEYARELILSTNLALKEIAPRAGLSDEYTLSRIFRKHYSMPPGRLRRGG